MEMVKVTFEVPKEFSEIGTALVELLKDGKAGKPAGVIAAENLQNVLNAITGADKVGAEAKDHPKEMFHAAFWLAAQILTVFIDLKGEKA